MYMTMTMTMTMVLVMMMMTESQTHRLTDSQTQRLTDSQTHSQTHRLTDSQTYRLTDSQTHSQTHSIGDDDVDDEQCSRKIDTICTCRDIAMSSIEPCIAFVELISNTAISLAPLSKLSVARAMHAMPAIQSDAHCNIPSPWPWEDLFAYGSCQAVEACPSMHGGMLGPPILQGCAY